MKEEADSISIIIFQNEYLHLFLDIILVIIKSQGFLLLKSYPGRMETYPHRFDLELNPVPTI